MAATPSCGTGGYDYNFVKPPFDSLLCTICFLPSKEPYLTACCGHTFCKSCLDGSKKSSNTCPMCRSEDFPTIFNKQSDRLIRSLHIFCTNKEKGCNWQGEVNDINGHLGNCLFQVIHCPNECGECLQRQHLTSHVETKCPHRLVSCQYCNDVGEYQFIEGQHKEECPKFPIQCPNECEIESIYRDEVEKHREVCPLEMIHCDYHVVGCKDKIARKDMNIHKQEMMEMHLSLSINELMETKTQLKSAQNNLKSEMEKAKDDVTQQLIASQQEAKKTIDGLNEKILLVEKHSSKQLTTMGEETITQLENFRQQLLDSQLEAMKIKKDLTAELVASQQEASQQEASQQEAKRTENQLLQKLLAIKNELDSTKQQLGITCQNLTKAEKELTKLAASTDKAVTKMKAMIDEAVATVDKKMAEALQQKAKVIEEMSNPWFISIQYQAINLSPQNQFVPLVLKITEFTNNVMLRGWCSKPFHYYDRTRALRRLRLVVAPRIIDGITYISVSLRTADQLSLSDIFPPIYDLRTRFRVKLLNQVGDSEHVEDTQAIVGSFFDRFADYHNKRFISYKDLLRNTVTCEYLRNDTVFFEVLQP